MRIYRDSDERFRESPLCQAYALKGGNLIAPIDLCIFEYRNRQRTFISSVNSSTFKNANIIEPGPVNVGKIENYNPPSLLSSVNSVVKIKPSDGFNFPSEIRNLDTPSEAQDIPVDPNDVQEVDSVNGPSDQVVFYMEGIPKYGDIYKSGIQTVTYLSNAGGFEIQVYQVLFNNTLTKDTHGAKVLYGTGSKRLLGMLIATEINNQKSFGYVYPAHLI